MEHDDGTTVRTAAQYQQIGLHKLVMKVSDPSVRQTANPAYFEGGMMCYDTSWRLIQEDVADEHG